MTGKRLLTALLLVALLALIVGGRLLGQALEVATGYSAKQLCSGVFVAELPAEFVIRNDIHLAMGVLGPLLPQLKLDVDEERPRVYASLLGVDAVAVDQPPTGCVLNPAGADTLAANMSVDSVIAEYRIPPELPPTGELTKSFDAAFAEPVEGQRRTLAVVVMHRGKVVAERYAGPVNQQTPLQGWSMNKSLMATWIGMQVAKDRLSLGASVRDAIAAVDPSLAENVDPTLNLGHLLHMESGFDFVETYAPGDDATRMLYRSQAMWRVAPGNGHAFPPGQHFSYSSGDTNLAAWMWTRSLGDAPYSDWLTGNFNRNPEISVWRNTHEHDASGVQVGSSYSYMPARSWAAVGQFWLDAYHGRSRTLSQQWMRESVTPRPANIEGNYGRGFWLNTQGKDFPTLPRDFFYASGHNSQYVAVFPDQELVVVRLGLSSGRAADGVAALLEGVLARFSASNPIGL